MSQLLNQSKDENNKKEAEIANRDAKIAELDAKINNILEGLGLSEKDNDAQTGGRYNRFF